MKSTTIDYETADDENFYIDMGFFQMRPKPSATEMYILSCILGATKPEHTTINFISSKTYKNPKTIANTISRLKTKQWIMKEDGVLKPTDVFASVLLPAREKAIAIRKKHEDQN